jgi:hypothetical protein
MIKDFNLQDAKGKDTPAPSTTLSEAVLPRKE